ncbi:MAG: PAS domain-containing protein, partial [bacterium]|nr:PAS domain-containing protein [bacterium]
MVLEKRRLSDIIFSTNVGTWEWNIQTGELRVNKRWIEIVGYAATELDPVSIDTWRNLAHPDDLLESDRILAEHFVGELEYYECEARMKHRNGHWVWILDRGKVVSQTDNGEPLMMYGTHLEISKRKKAEIDLRDSEEKARALMNATEDYAMLLKPDGTIVEANQAISDLFNLSPTALVGKCPFDFAPPQVAERRRGFLATIVSDRKPLSVEDENKGRFFSSSGYPILDA